MAYYTVSKEDGCWRIGSAENVFSYLIEGQTAALLIDTGYGFGDLKKTVRALTDKPLHIVNTHGHCDHTGGNAQFSEPILLHPADWPLCRQHNAPAFRQKSCRLARRSLNYETGRTFNALPVPFSEAAYCARGTGTLLPAQDGQKIELGGVTLTLVATTGHTRGGISVWWPEKGLLFSGDAIGPFVWLFGPEADGRAPYLAMLQKIQQMPVRRLLTGHSPVPLSPGALPLYARAAREAVYAAGQPFETPIFEGVPARVCALDGKTMDDLFAPDFAAVVICQDF